MADTPKVYVLCDANCKWEGMTKEQILTAITQAVNEGTISNIDTGFVQTIKTINGHGLKFFVGEQSEYDALSADDKQDLFAIITNDITREGLLNAFNDLKNGIESGAITARRAVNADYATNAGTASKLATDPFPAPTFKIQIPNASGAYGYYYVYISTTINGVVNFGIFYWSGKAAKIGEVVSGYPNIAYRLEITDSGMLKLYTAQTQADGSIGSYTESSDPMIYVARIGKTN